MAVNPGFHSPSPPTSKEIDAPASQHCLETFWRYIILINYQNLKFWNHLLCPFISTCCRVVARTDSWNSWANSLVKDLILGLSSTELVTETSLSFLSLSWDDVDLRSFLRSFRRSFGRELFKWRSWSCCNVINCSTWPFDDSTSWCLRFIPANNDNSAENN